MHLFEVAQGAVQQDQTPGGHGSRGHQSWQLYGTLNIGIYWDHLYLLMVSSRISLGSFWYQPYLSVHDFQCTDGFNSLKPWVTAEAEWLLLFWNKIYNLFTVGPISTKNHPSLKFFHGGIQKVWVFFHMWTSSYHLVAVIKSIQKDRAQKRLFLIHRFLWVGGWATPLNSIMVKKIINVTNVAIRPWDEMCKLLKPPVMLFMMLSCLELGHNLKHSGRLNLIHFCTNQTRMEHVWLNEGSKVVTLWFQSFTVPHGFI